MEKRYLAPIFVVAMVTLYLNSGAAFTCDNGATVDDEKICDFKQDCSDGSDEKTCPAICGFESTDLCYWIQDEGDDLDWSYYDSSTIYHEYRGPVTDHTTQTGLGHYLFVDGVTSRTLDIARLISPTYKMAPRGCAFNMWVYMFGIEYGDLEVKMLDDSGLTHVAKILDNAPQYGKWLSWESPIRPCTKNFQIQIETEDLLSIPSEGGFAIDDVAFTNCEFPDQMGPSQCANGYRQCNSGECYPEGQHCDMELDCCDLTDESNCDQQGYNQCDFESSGVCDWTQSTNDDFDWTWQQGGTPDNWRRTGPQYDHTTGNVEGRYIYTESSRRRVNDRAVFVSFPIKGLTPDRQCFIRFFYHMEGQGIGSLNVYTWTIVNGPMNQLWSENRQTGEHWNYMSLELNEESDFQVVFEGVIGFTSESDIALDDISFTPGCERSGASLPVATTLEPVICIPEEIPCDDTCIDRSKYCDFAQDCEDNQDEQDCPAICDFDRDLCEWTQDVSDDIDWSVFSSRTVPPGYKGPATDHTSDTATGRYVYVDGQTSRTGDIARLVSPRFTVSPRGCMFDMWFYMFGPEYGDLKVKLWKDGIEEHVTRALDNALQYNKWWEWNSEIPPCTSYFQIVIESEDKLIGPFESGFAVDDVSFRDCTFIGPMDIGACPTDYLQCNSRHCYPADQFCDMELDCCDGTDETDCVSKGYIQCDFEAGMCDELMQLTSDDFDWTWQQGGTPDNWRRTGPTEDHTKRNEYGYYYYTESSQRRNNGDIARLGSYTIAATTSGECRIRFFYHMEGQGIGTLKVYTRTAINGALEEIFSEDDSQGEQWNYANLQLRVNSDFQVVFEVRVGLTAESDIGLDDVSFTPDCIPAANDLPIIATKAMTTRGRIIPTIPPCEPDEFTCTLVFRCIDKSRVCDGVSDCSDGQDEFSCPTDNTAMVIGLSVTFSFLFVVALAAAIYYIMVYSKKSKKSVESDAAPGVVNPSYGDTPMSFTSGKVEEFQT